MWKRCQKEQHNVLKMEIATSFLMPNWNFEGKIVVPNLEIIFHTFSFHSFFVVCQRENVKFFSFPICFVHFSSLAANSILYECIVVTKLTSCRNNGKNFSSHRCVHSGIVWWCTMMQTRCTLVSVIFVSILRCLQKLFPSFVSACLIITSHSSHRRHTHTQHTLTLTREKCEYNLFFLLLQL